jgi:hypothetical protein
VQEAELRDLKPRLESKQVLISNIFFSAIKPCAAMFCLLLGCKAISGSRGGAADQAAQRHKAAARGGGKGKRLPNPHRAAFEFNRFAKGCPSRAGSGVAQGPARPEQGAACFIYSRLGLVFLDSQRSVQVSDSRGQQLLQEAQKSAKMGKQRIQV